MALLEEISKVLFEYIPNTDVVNLITRLYVSPIEVLFSKLKMKYYYNNSVIPYNKLFFIPKVFKFKLKKNERIKFKSGRMQVSEIADIKGEGGVLYDEYKWSYSKKLELGDIIRTSSWCPSVIGSPLGELEITLHTFFVYDLHFQENNIEDVISEWNNDKNFEFDRDFDKIEYKTLTVRIKTIIHCDISSRHNMFTGTFYIDKGERNNDEAITDVKTLLKINEIIEIN